jgi:hypothetical protein
MIPLPLGKLAEVGAKITGIIGDNINSLLHRKENLLAKEVDLKEVEAEVQKAVQDNLLEFAKIQQSEYEAMLKDTSNARDQNIAIQNSDKASWLSKNVAYLIDLFVFTIWGAMTVYIICKFLNIIKAQQGVDFSGILGIYSGITAIAMTVLNFHRGSSKGSEDKQKQLNNLQNR